MIPGWWMVSYRFHWTSCSRWWWIWRPIGEAREKAVDWTLNSHCFHLKRAGCFKFPSNKFMVFATIAAKSIFSTESPWVDSQCLFCRHWESTFPAAYSAGKEDGCKLRHLPTPLPWVDWAIFLSAGYLPSCDQYSGSCGNGRWFEKPWTWKIHFLFAT